MNPLEPSQNFEAARRQHLIDATIEALADVGFKAASLSQIARRADVSTGLFAHYFGDKDGLLEATLRFMAARLVRAMRQRLRAATTARDRLYAVPDSALADQEFERRTSAVWLAFWGQITHSARYQRIQFIYQRRMISNLRHDLRGLVPAHCVDSYATMIASMIDGVWIRSHASSEQADGAQARAIVRALIDGLIVGVHGEGRGGASDATKTKRKDKTATATMPIRPAPPAVQPCTIKIVSPTTNEVIGSFAAARHREIEAAVEKARVGLIAWQAMPGTGRERVLRRCAEALRTESDELAHLNAVCTGRALAQTIQTSLPRAARAFERVAGLASRPMGERVELSPGLFSYRQREPIGILAGFGHWSAPLLDPCRQAAPALALGNALLFQPSAQSPLTAQRLSGIMERVGVPPGVFTVLNGDAETTRLILVRTDGSPVSPTDTRPKSATIVLAGANLKQAAAAVLHGIRRWAPAPDISENIVFVQRRGLVAFRTHLLAHVKDVRMGDPLDPKMQVGALVSHTHLRHVLGLIEQAVAQGATCLSGGSGSGSFLAPTILDGCRTDMPVVRENLFAPVLTLLAFDDQEDVLQQIAARGPDCAVGIFSADFEQGHLIANRLYTNAACVNDSPSSEDEGCDVLELSIDEIWASRAYSRYKRILGRDDNCTGL